MLSEKGKEAMEAFIAEYPRLAHVPMLADGDAYYDDEVAYEQYKFWTGYVIGFNAHARTNPDTVPDSPWTAIETLPTQADWYLVATDHLGMSGFTAIDFFDGSEWSQDVLAWMPLPAPYAPTDSEIEVSECR